MLINGIEVHRKFMFINATNCYYLVELHISTKKQLKSKLSIFMQVMRYEKLPLLIYVFYEGSTQHLDNNI